jgi:thymidylate kinase
VLYVIEGCDAVGKATHAKILADRLGCDVLAFPDYTSPTGRAIKAQFDDAWSVHKIDGGHCADAESTFHDLVFQSLMLANRFEHFDKLALAAGSKMHHLVCDRYFASGIVYGTVEGLDPSWLELIHRGLPRADYWVLIDMPVELGFVRRPDRRDRNERDANKLQKVRDEYLRYFTVCCEASPAWRIVDGTGTIEEVSARVREAVGL